MPGQSLPRIERRIVEQPLYVAKRHVGFAIQQNLLQPTCELLEQRGWLAAGAWIYTESEHAPSSLGLPGNWRLHREKHAGQVHYALWQREVQ